MSCACIRNEIIFHFSRAHDLFQLLDCISFLHRLLHLIFNLNFLNIKKKVQMLFYLLSFEFGFILLLLILNSVKNILD